jgi:hypothetical protein
MDMSDLSWLWQAAAWDWVLVPLGGALLAYLKKKHPDWAGTLVYGLGGAAFIAIILFTAVGRPVFSKPLQKTTPENLEANIRIWAADAEYSIAPGPADAAAVFRLVLRLDDGKTLDLVRMKAAGRDKYLVISASLTLEQSQRKELSALSDLEQKLLADDLTIELAKYKNGFVLSGPPLNTWNIEKRVPITAALNEESFIDAVTEIDSEIVVSGRLCDKAATIHNLQREKNH